MALKEPVIPITEPPVAKISEIVAAKLELPVKVIYSISIPHTKKSFFQKTFFSWNEIQC
jgi:hypothetical protein